MTEIPRMISLEEAQELVLSHTTRIPAETVPLIEASGRVAAEDICDPKTGEIVVSRDKMMSDKDAETIVNTYGVTRIKIRSVLTCEAKHGVCARCYGSNLATVDPVTVARLEP